MSALILTLLASATAQLDPVAAPDEPVPIPLAPGRLELGVEGGPRGITIADLDGDGKGELLVATQQPGSLFVFSGLGPTLAPITPPRQYGLEDYSIGPVAGADGRLHFGLRTLGSLLTVQLPEPGSEAEAGHAPADEGSLEPGADSAGSTGTDSEADAQTNGQATTPTAGAANGEDAGDATTRASGGAIFERHDLGGTPRALDVATVSWFGERAERVAVVTDTPELLVFRDGALETRCDLADRLPTAVALVDRGVAVASQGAPSVIFYAARPGGLSQNARIDLDEIPRDMIAVDLDGDHDDELVWVMGVESAVTLGFGAGGGLDPWLDAGATPPPPLHWLSGTLPLDLTHADIDHDGREELISIFNADLIAIVLDEFTTTGPMAINPLYAGAGPWQSAVGDLNGDGHIDLAVTNPEAGAVSVFFGRDVSGEETRPAALGPPGSIEGPFGGFTSAPNWESVPAPHSMSAGDFDGDGHDDVVLLSGLGDRAGMLFGDAEGGFGAPLHLPLPPEADEVVAADFASPLGHEVVMLHQEAGGTHLAALVRKPGTEREFLGLTTSGSAPLAVEAAGLLAADLNHDGLDELVLADAAGKALVVVRPSLDILDDSGVEPVFALHAEVVLRLDVQGRPGPMAAVHARTADGSERLIGLAIGLATPEGGALSLALFDDAGNPRLVGTLGLPRPPKDLVAADLNADGQPDLIALCQGANDNAAGTLHAFLSPKDGDGGWQTLPAQQVGPKAFSVAALDLNGDGAAEVFASSQYGYRVDAFVGDPNTGIPARTWRLGAHRGCMDLEFLDVDGDGRDELAVSNNHSSDVSLLRFPRD
ncbi:MAG: VCBS repeat-containing protein [Planctomycetota bacterium]|nr:VCBS repeat-containing protein [Planctomycetota bacterium]